ncbi:trichothecene 3-O-acetyltransferase, partial [Ascobolus immersus RN42]
YPLDIFGQQPCLNMYTPIAMFYRVADDSQLHAAVETVKGGLHQLAQAFPWLSGQVVCEGAGPDCSGTYNIKPYRPDIHLFVKDLREDARIPPFSDFEAAEFPFRLVSENDFCPVSALPGGFTHELIPDGIIPVFILQVNFIRGGLVITPMGHHQALDGTGYGIVLSLLDKACRNEPFTEEELTSLNNIDRTTILPTLPSLDISNSALKYQLRPSTSTGPLAPCAPAVESWESPEECSWTYFTFSPTSIASLKALASTSLSPTTPYITTDDALTAFITHHIFLSRVPRLSDQTVALCRAISIRSALGIPKLYPGMAHHMSYLPLSLPPPPFPEMAVNLRSLLNDTDTIRANAAALATLFTTSADKNVATFTAGCDMTKDLMLSSWAGMPCYGMDLGMGLGKPVGVRRPRFFGVEGLLFIMPKREDGETVVAVCLRGEDLERLRRNQEWSGLAREIG